MQKIRIFFWGGIILLLAYNCKNKDEQNEGQVTWADNKPLSIPKNIRLQQFKKGNLVLNPSFETGKYFYEDSLVGSFDLKGWKKIGSNVDWISILDDSTLSKEVSDGNHSIKIIRNDLNEVEELGDGIMSDFIKVIPGNYSLSFDIKLQDIVSNLERFGNKLFDAVNIRLFFYDKNKLPIDAASYAEFTHSTIDKSFKGHNFSGFKNISAFGWGKVTGKSYNQPLLEGNIPGEAKYVKLFWGLKGRGVMWVDNVNFSYTKYNFTTIERVEPYFDSLLAKTRLITPTPKQINPLHAITYYNKEGTGSKPLILIPYKPSEGIINASLLLKNKLNSIFNTLLGTKQEDYVKIIHSLKDEDINPDALIFSIGPTVLFKIHKQGLPLDEIAGKPQAYFIHNIPGISQVVYLYGDEPVSNYYAVTTIMQLLDNTMFVYHSANIVDYPDYLDRAYLGNGVREEQIKQGVGFMSACKFNCLYAMGGEGKIIDLGELQKICEKNATGLSVCCPGSEFFSQEQQSEGTGKKIYYRYNYRNIDLGGIKENISKIRSIAVFGADITCYPPGQVTYYVLKGEDKKRFITTQNADIFILNTLSEWLKKTNPLVKLEYLPPYYTNELINSSNGYGEHYFSDFVYQLQDISLFWAGNINYSLSIDMADVYFFQQLAGKNIVYFNNSFMADSIPCFYPDEDNNPGILRKQDMFQPFEVAFPDNFYLYTTGRKMLINKFPVGEIDKIKLATAADYLWNTKSYDPDFSLWKVLIANYGKSIAIELLMFNDDYYCLADLCHKISKGENKGKNIRQAKIIMQKLNSRVDLLSGKLKSDNKLVEELRLKEEEMEKKYNLLVQ